MSRRRYISTEISVDARINRLDDFAALLYTWMIPHADDDGTLPADPEEIAMRVIPGRRNVTIDQVNIALESMMSLYLIAKVNGRIEFPSASFYKYQTYIPVEKRCKEAQSADNTEERRKTPNKAVSPSPSPSPSPPIVPQGDDALEVFTYWCDVMGKRGDTRLDDKRLRAIKRGLAAVGLDGCKQAIDGCALSDFHMGRDPKTAGRRQNKLTLIFRDAEHWEGFIESAGEMGASRELPPPTNFEGWFD